MAISGILYRFPWSMMNNHVIFSGSLVTSEFREGSEISFFFKINQCSILTIDAVDFFSMESLLRCIAIILAAILDLEISIFVIVL